MIHSMLDTITQQYIENSFLSTYEYMRDHVAGAYPEWESMPNEETRPQQHGERLRSMFNAEQLEWIRELSQKLFESAQINTQNFFKQQPKPRLNYSAIQNTLEMVINSVLEQDERYGVIYNAVFKKFGGELGYIILEDRSATMLNTFLESYLESITSLKNFRAVFKLEDGSERMSVCPVTKFNITFYKEIYAAITNPEF